MHLCVLFQSVKTKMSRLLLKTKITKLCPILFLGKLIDLHLANLGDDRGVVFPHHQHQIVQTREHLDFLSPSRFQQRCNKQWTHLWYLFTRFLCLCACANIDVFFACLGFKSGIFYLIDFSCHSLLLCLFDVSGCHLFVCFVLRLTFVVQIGQVVRSWLKIYLIRHKTKSSFSFYQKVGLVERVMPVLSWGHEILIQRFKYFQRDHKRPNYTKVSPDGLH